MVSLVPLGVTLTFVGWVSTSIVLWDILARGLAVYVGTHRITCARVRMYQLRLLTTIQALHRRIQSSGTHSWILMYQQLNEPARSEGTAAREMFRLRLHRFYDGSMSRALPFLDLNAQTSSKNMWGARTQSLLIKLHEIYLSSIHLVHLKGYHTRQGMFHQCKIVYQTRPQMEVGATVDVGIVLS